MSGCLDRPAQRPSPPPPLPPRRPQEAGQTGRLGVPSPDRQAAPMAFRQKVKPASTAHLPPRPTCRPEAPAHQGPPQQPAPDPRPARKIPLIPLVPRPTGADKSAAAPASQLAATLPNGGDRGRLTQVCCIPLDPTRISLWAMALDRLLLALQLRIIPAAKPRPLRPLLLVRVGGSNPR